MLPTALTPAPTSLPLKFDFADVEVKQTLSSLSYLKKFCETQIVKLSQSSREDEVDFLVHNSTHTAARRITAASLHACLYCCILLSFFKEVPISVPKTTLSFHYALNNEICLHHFNGTLSGTVDGALTTTNNHLHLYIYVV